MVRKGAAAEVDARFARDGERVRFLMESRGVGPSSLYPGLMVGTPLGSGKPEGW